MRRFRELKRAGVDLFHLTRHEGVDVFPVETRWNELTDEEKKTFVYRASFRIRKN
jgi:hypothetical protein